jgi:hypothetical protein
MYHTYQVKTFSLKRLDREQNTAKAHRSNCEYTQARIKLRKSVKVYPELSELGDNWGKILSGS